MDAERPPTTPPSPRSVLGTSRTGRVRGAIALATALAAMGLLSPAFAQDPARWLGNPNDDPSFGDATPYERFGESFALDGDRLAVGVHGAYDESVQPVGRVQVFERSGANWSRIATLEPPVPQAWSRFGAAVALDGSTLVVSAPYQSAAGVFNGGQVTVYAFDGAQFVQQQVLFAPSEEGLLYFGGELALDGDTLAIAARHTSGSSPSNAGTVLIYRRIGGSWQLRQTLLATEASASDGFGITLHLEGELLLVGAPGESQRGAAYAYTLDQDQWVLRQRFTAPPASTADGFGTAVVGNGGRILIGATSILADSRGAVFEWRRDGATWVAGQTLSMPGQADLRHFGTRLARHGGRWLVAAERGATSAAPSRIELFGYVESGNELSLERQISLSYVPRGYHSLRKIALDAQSAFVGLPASFVAPWSEGGEVRVVPLQSGTAEVSLSDGATAAGEQFGSALAAHPQWLAVGAPFERRMTAIRGGVFVLPRIGGDPVPGVAPPLTVPELGPGAQFGGAVAFSGDTLVASAPLREGGGSVHAFAFDGLAWQPVTSWRAGTNVDYFGERLDADADRIVASAPWSAAGDVVYVMERVGAGWAPPLPVAANGSDAIEWFGSDLDLDGEVLAVASQGRTTGGFGEPIVLDGAAYVFTHGTAGWSQQARLQRPPSDVDDADFGAAIALDGDLLAVGAPEGREVHLFRNTGGVWSWVERIAGPGTVDDYFGSRIRWVDGDMWIDAPVTNRLYRFRRDATTWRLVQTVATAGGIGFGRLGTEFVVSESWLFIGAPVLTGHHPRVYRAGAVLIDGPSLFADGFEP